MGAIGDPLGSWPIHICDGSHEWCIHAGRGGRRSGATAAGALSMRWAEADGRKAASRSSVLCVLYISDPVCLCDSAVECKAKGGTRVTLTARPGPDAAPHAQHAAASRLRLFTSLST